MFNTPSVFSRIAEQDVWRHASRTIKLFILLALWAGSSGWILNQQSPVMLRKNDRFAALRVTGVRSLIETLPDCAYLCRCLPTSPSVKKFLGSVMGD
jgi:hypothetical protein